MTEISFYHLTTSTMEKSLPKLVEKIYDLGHKIVIFFDDMQKMQIVDDLLWTYSQKTFLAHGTLNDEMKEVQPIYLTTQEENPNLATILIKVGNKLPEYFPSFHKVIDIFSANNEIDLLAARERYKNCKTSHNVSYYKQNADGSWSK